LEEELDAPLFSLGNDDDYKGLRLEKELEEEYEALVVTSHDVSLE